MNPPPPYPRVEAWTSEDAAPVAEDERALWEESREQVRELEEGDLVLRDAELDAYLEAVVGRIGPRVHESGPRFRVLVTRDAEANAAGLPDGSILMTTSLLAQLRNEAELALILGHEIAHIVERDSLVSTRYRALTASHVERMTLSRKIESRADRVGLSFVLEAGYPEPGRTRGDGSQAHRA